MALKSYIMTHDYKAPYVVATGLAHNPSSIKFRKYRRGEIIKGELKHANNKPAFILVNGVAVVPLHVVKELVTKEVVSHTDGQSPTKEIINKTVGASKNNSNPNVRYIDAMLIGALLGVGAVFLAEKQGWIAEPERKFKLYGAAGGALLAMYFVYRQKTQRKVNVSSITKE